MSNMQFDVKIRKLADEPARGKLDFQRDEWEAMRLNRVHKMQTHAGALPPTLTPWVQNQSLRCVPIIYLFTGEKREFRSPGVYYQNGWIQYQAMMCSK